MPSFSTEVLDRFLTRFDAIGPWEVHAGGGGATVSWDQPMPLAELGCRVSAEFETHTETGDIAPDESMLTLWETFYRGWPRHAAYLRREMVAIYRDNQPDLIPAERERFRDDLTADEVMAWVRATVRVQRFESGGDRLYDLEVSFAAAWDGEHAWAFEYDAHADEFGESSKG